LLFSVLPLSGFARVVPPPLLKSLFFFQSLASRFLLEGNVTGKQHCDSLLRSFFFSHVPPGPPSPMFFLFFDRGQSSLFFPVSSLRLDVPAQVPFLEFNLQACPPLYPFSVCVGPFRFSLSQILLRALSKLKTYPLALSPRGTPTFFLLCCVYHFF